MTTKLTVNTERRLHRKAEEIEREASDLRKAGLDDRAEILKAEAGQIRTRIEESKRARQRADLERQERRREARERHDKAQREREAARERREEAREWFRSWRRFHGGRPAPVERAVDAAEAAGIAREDLLAAMKLVKRRSDGAECLVAGSYLRRDYLPVES